MDVISSSPAPGLKPAAAQAELSSDGGAARGGLRLELHLRPVPQGVRAARDCLGSCPRWLSVSG